MVANIEALALKLPVLFSCRQAQSANLPQIQFENEDIGDISGPVVALKHKLTALVGPNPYESEPRLAGALVQPGQMQQSARATGLSNDLSNDLSNNLSRSPAPGPGPAPASAPDPGPTPTDNQAAYIKQSPARLRIRRAQGLNPLQPESAIEQGPKPTDQPGTIYIDIDWQGQFLIWGLALDRKALKQAGAYVYRFGQLAP